MAKIGIFTATKKDKERVSFFGRDNISLLAALYKDASTIAGHTLEPFSPENGMKVRKIGEVNVEPVEDNEVYIVNAEKEETERQPSGKAGEWAVQSVLFSKDTFTKEQAQQWIADSENFGEYGIDETDTSYRFRQFDPKYFSEFRTAALVDGVSAVYGKIAGDEMSADAAEKAMSESIKRFEAVRKINQSMMKNGVRILCGSAQTKIIKAEETQEEFEEHYVLSMVLEPTDGKDGAVFQPDTQKDVYSADAVRKACHTWMEHYGAVDLMHNWKAIGKEDVRTLECYIAPCKFKAGEDEIQKGSWMLALRIVNDDLWSAIKSGDLGAFSIGGTANRVPLENA